MSDCCHSCDSCAAQRVLLKDTQHKLAIKEAELQAIEDDSEDDVPELNDVQGDINARFDNLVNHNKLVEAYHKKQRRRAVILKREVKELKKIIKKLQLDNAELTYSVDEQCSIICVQNNEHKTDQRMFKAAQLCMELQRLIIDKTIRNITESTGIENIYQLEDYVNSHSSSVTTWNAIKQDILTKFSSIYVLNSVMRVLKKPRVKKAHPNIVINEEFKNDIHLYCNEVVKGDNTFKLEKLTEYTDAMIELYCQLKSQ